MKKIALIICVMLVTSCAPVTRQTVINPNESEAEKAIQQELALKIQLKNNLKVRNIADRVAHAAVPYCKDEVAAGLGLILSSKKTVGADFVSTAERLWSITDQPTIIAMTTDSLAEKSGLMVGDVILKVNDKAVKPESATLTEYFAKPFDESAVANFVISREGEEITLPVQAQKVCDYPASVVADSSVNAFANGEAIFITTGMLRFVETDEELATVIGHEIAHNQMGHIKKKKTNSIVGAIFGAIFTVATGVDMTQTFANIGAASFSQGFEAEADYVGIYNVALAGYDISQAANFWRRMGVEHPAAISHGSSHPSTANRFVGLDNAVKEINEKIATGQELVPNESSTVRVEHDTENPLQ